MSVQKQQTTSNASSVVSSQTPVHTTQTVKDNNMLAFDISNVNACDKKCAICGDGLEDDGLTLCFACTHDEQDREQEEQEEQEREEHDKMQLKISKRVVKIQDKEIKRLREANNNKVDIINALQREFRQFTLDVDIEITRLKTLNGGSQ